MSEYTPDNWVILKLGGPDPHYRVLGGWFGGYLDGDSWRLNSGITSHKFDGEYWYFYGTTGSCYKCYVDSYRMGGSMSHVYQNLLDKYGEDVIQLVGDQEWNNKAWDWLLDAKVEHK
jgi:hypothetical protein